VRHRWGSRQALRHLRLVTVLITVLMLAGCHAPRESSSSPVTLRVAGSTSMLPIIQDLADAYSQGHPGVYFEISAADSEAGLLSLRQGRAELALVSRLLTQDEESGSAYGNQALSQTVIAHDDVAIIVHPANPVRNLSLIDLRSVFGGQVSSWQELGGLDTPIEVVSREAGSGTRNVFEHAVMNGRRVTPNAVVLPNSSTVLDYVQTHEGAVAYLSSLYITPATAVLGVDAHPAGQSDSGADAYPITRPLLLVAHKESSAELRAFVAFCVTRMGAAAVSSAMQGIHAAGQSAAAPHGVATNSPMMVLPVSCSALIPSARSFSTQLSRRSLSIPAGLGFSFLRPYCVGHGLSTSMNAKP